ncbi:GNAT family N-acetyltransferase [Dermabacteraceae bacterium P7074]
MAETVIASCSETAQLPDLPELLDLYDSVGWSAYTQVPEALLAGVRGSLHVVAAREVADVNACVPAGKENRGRLIGLARVVGDGATICYLQDILVHPDYRRAGIGSRLIEAAFAPFPRVRQHVLITDEEPGQKAFYETAGFKQLGEGTPGRAFVRFN